MKLVPYRENDPFREIDRMFSELRGLMNQSLLERPAWQSPDAYRLALDVTEDDKHIMVTAAIPGVSEDDIDISVTNNVLTISAETESRHEDEGTGWHVREMRYGKFARSVTLPAEVNLDDADAEIENGILTIKLPKEQPGPVQKIAVKAKKLLAGNGKKRDES